MEAASDLICSCGEDLHVSGYWRYVSEETRRFHNLHQGEGHAIQADLDPGDKRGRDNGTRWWEKPRWWEKKGC